MFCPLRVFVILSPIQQVANPAAATIDKFLKQRQSVVVELGDIVVKTLEEEHHPVMLMEGFNTVQKTQDFLWFNNAQNFANTLQGMLDLGRAIQVGLVSLFSFAHNTNSAIWSCQCSGARGQLSQACAICRQSKVSTGAGNSCTTAAAESVCTVRF